jgi:hypothetical protein
MMCMLQEVMAYYGFRRDLRHVGYFETAQHQQIVAALKAAITQGQMELVHASGETLSVVLAGHPKLTNDLRRPAIEEIGSRATVFLLDGVKGQQRAYITWLLEQCTTAQAREGILTDSALALLADRLSTPLQIEHYFIRALEEGHKVGQKPLTPELIESVLAQDLDDLEPRLTRHGDHTKALADLLQVRPTDIHAFLAGRLPPRRTQALPQELLAAGLPLGAAVCRPLQLVSAAPRP